MSKSILATCMGVLLSIGAFACPTSLNAIEQSCGSYVFYLADTPVGNVIWNFGDGSSTTGSIEIAHQYAENGMYVVSATFSGPECPQTLTLTATVEVNCGVVNECPIEIWSGAGAECGVMNFEIGSFAEGENVTWFTGDNSGSQQGGHFFSHTYATAGTYDVCAFYTSPLCPNGVELCTTITVEPCEQPCNEIGFGIDSYVLDGGTPWLTYMISNVESGMMVTSGAAEYTENDPYFDTPLCIPDGCYYLSIDNNNPLLIGQGVNIFFILNSVNLMENATIVYQDNISIRYLIGVNTDCSEPALCETAFEPVYTNTPGHVEFINNSIYTGNAEFLWDYGNGQFSNDFYGNVQYESNGVYSVCLTVTTVNCTYSSCQVVVIEDMENACSFNEVTLVVEANYFEPMFDEVFYLTIANGNFPIHELTFETTGNLSDTLGFCLHDGCYGVTLSSESSIMALSLIASFTGENTQQLGELQLSFSETFASAVIGVNMDCTIDVEETNAKTVSAFPNPASNYIQFESRESIQLLEIFDMTGKRITTLNPNQSQVQFNTSAWSNGLYVAHLTVKGKIESVVFEINRYND